MRQSRPVPSHKAVKYKIFTTKTQDCVINPLLSATKTRQEPKNPTQTEPRPPTSTHTFVALPPANGRRSPIAVKQNAVHSTLSIL